MVDSRRHTDTGSGVIATQAPAVSSCLSSRLVAQSLCLERCSCAGFVDVCVAFYTLRCEATRAVSFVVDLLNGGEELGGEVRFGLSMPKSLRPHYVLTIVGSRSVRGLDLGRLAFKTRSRSRPLRISWQLDALKLVRGFVAGF
ncbi:hypothetical protein P154DRAFT_520114 [Amniculicola lignicola CBS 123094]|uniref:Uncharacterized protein n=1 Tax=Amniculicola lignicola CBS 123094 TaxID=1392246 RepID=A0A6A5WNL6_9PLEO|nr:hypothetical protein P154DRAFT_520114 [Amniculicola lignicola CBS 123094]